MASCDCLHSPCIFSESCSLDEVNPINKTNVPAINTAFPWRWSSRCFVTLIRISCDGWHDQQAGSRQNWEPGYQNQCWAVRSWPVVVFGYVGGSSCVGRWAAVWRGGGKAACLSSHPGLELPGGTYRGAVVGSRAISGEPPCAASPSLEIFWNRCLYVYVTDCFLACAEVVAAFCWCAKILQGLALKTQCFLP